jgi:hypothetical protein
MANQRKQKKMPVPLIKKLHEIYLETKTVDLPEELLPAEINFNLIAWVRELYCYYREEGLVVRAFDDLPPLRLSAEEQISARIQDVHAFIINDLNMIPMKTRRMVIGEILEHESAADAWERIASMLIEMIGETDMDEVQQDLSWNSSPLLELLWALSWFFLEMEAVQPPQTVHMHSTRFPYYRWAGDDQTQTMWEPEVPLCRPQWLAMDMFRRRMESED